MDYKTIINSGIKRLRINLNITQDKFAEYIGLSVQGLRNIEQNKYQPTSDTINNICRVFNIEPIDLLLPDKSNEELNIIEKINLKLKGSSKEELQRINDVIDLIRKKY